MRRMIKYPSISQYRQIVKEITERACFIGLDEEGKAQFDYLKPKPVLEFSITPKAHGTNAGVCYSEPDGIWGQSRENVITVEKDNMGFAWFVEQNKETVISIIRELAKENNIDLNTHIISVFGEWIGKGIQKNVAISELDKRFVIFEHFKVSPIEPQEDSDVENIEKAKWFKTISYSDFGVPHPTIEWAESPENKIFNIMNFQTNSNRTISIDFNNPEKAQNELIKIMQEVETECPIGKAFGVSGTGEGVVISHLTEDGSLIQAKVKGTKHNQRGNKIDKIVSNNIEKHVIDFVNNIACTEDRLNQQYDLCFDIPNGGFYDNSKIGLFLKMVYIDILKEEMDIMINLNIEPKNISKLINKSCLSYLNNLKF